MKLLLTSGGISNPSIEAALVDLAGKPIAECDALIVATALYGQPMAGPRQAWRVISGNEHRSHMVDLGWKSMGVLELSALPTLDPGRWVPLVREADVLLVDGGEAAFLCHWLRASGLADLLPTLDAVWVSVSAGSMAMTPRTGMDFIRWHSPAGDTMLGVVDFAIFPHVENPMLPDNTLAAAEQWAAEIGCPAYALDDQSAIRWVDGDVEVVSEGLWKKLR